MATTAFPSIGEPLTAFLDADGRFDPNKAGVKKPHWVYHLDVRRLDVSGPLLELEPDAVFLLNGENRHRLDLIANHLSLSRAPGKYRIHAKELMPNDFVYGHGNYAPQHEIVGTSYEMALAVGLAAAAEVASVPNWVLFTGVLNAELNDLSFGPTGDIEHKVRLALGLDGYERDFVNEVYGACTKDPDRPEKVMGPEDVRVKPGRVKLMFVPTDGLKDVPSHLVHKEVPVDLVRQHRVASRGTTDLEREIDSHLTPEARLLVVGVERVQDVLAFLGFGEPTRGAVYPARVVGREPKKQTGGDPPPPDGSVTFSVGSAAITFRAVPMPGGTVLAFAEDVISYETYWSVCDGTSTAPGLTAPNAPFAGERATTRAEAAELIRAWLEKFQDVVREAARVRLPKPAEWAVAVTPAERADPRRYAHLGSDRPEVIGSAPRTGGSRRLSPNAHGLYDLLGNFPEVACDPGGELHLMGWCYRDQAARNAPIRTAVFPPNGRAEWSFRPVLEFSTGDDWLSLADNPRSAAS